MHQYGEFKTYIQLSGAHPCTAPSTEQLKGTVKHPLCLISWHFDWGRLADGRQRPGKER